jgi:hypothetical protein
LREKDDFKAAFEFVIAFKEPWERGGRTAVANSKPAK